MTKSTQCKCLDKVCAQLKEYNTTIETKMMVNFETGSMRESPPLLKTMKIDDKKRKPAKDVICSHCPFCGKKYED